MSEAAIAPAAPALAAANVLAALPWPALAFDAAERLAHVNAAAWRFLAVDPSNLPLGAPAQEVVRLLAYRGVLGTGDPEFLAQRFLALDRNRPQRRLLRHVDGSLQELSTRPLPDGGFVGVLVDVTDHVAAAAAAAAGERRLTLTLDQLRSGVALFDPEDILLLANPAFEELAQLPRGTARPGIAKTAILDVLTGIGAFGERDAAALVAHRLGLDRSRPHRYQHERPNGQVVQIESRPMPDGGHLIESRDVTALTLAEAEARRRAALLDGVLAALPQGVVVFGPDGRVTMVNAAHQAILVGSPVTVGENRTEIAARRARTGEYGPGADPDKLARDALVPRPSLHTEVRHRVRPNGTVLELRYAPLADGGHVQVTHDITALQRAEQAAVDRARLLQTAMDSMRHGIIVFDAAGRVRASNRLVERLSGLTAADLAPGTPFSALRRRQYERGEIKELHGLDLADASRDAPMITTPYVRARPDGTMVEVLTDSTPDGGFVRTFSDVTARAHAEAEVRDRAAMLQATLDNTRHGIIMYGPDRRVLAANRLAAPPLGLPTLETRIGDSFDALVREQQATGVFGEGEAAARAAEMVLNLDRTVPQRYHRQLSNGRVIAVASDPTLDGGFVVTHSDVTEVVEAQAEAQRRAAVLQAMLDNIRHGICYYGPDRRVIAANALAAELGGHGPGALHPGQSIDALIAEQLRTGVVPAGAVGVAEMALTMDRSRPARYTRPAADGRILEVTSDPTPDGGFVVTQSDITALAHAEAEAQRRAGILQVMLDTIRPGIGLIDREGRVVAANPVFRHVLGLRPEHLEPGRHFTDFVDWLADRGEYGEGEARDAMLRDIKSRDRSVPFRMVRTAPGGRVLEVVTDPTPDGGWVLAVTDVTEDRRIRDELQAARDAAEEANRAKSRFLATMSHELRTPLNAVIGFSEALQADPDPVRGAEYVRSIHEAGRHLLSLIDDILDVARAETTGLNLREDRVDLAELTKGALRVTAVAAAAGSVALRSDVPAGLPPVRADAVRVRQVLLNLLSNAVKFTPPGGTVTVDAALDTDGLSLRVTDTGIGIRPDDIPRAFEPFTQLDASLSRRFGGSGLGLFLSRALATAQGAELSLRSSPGQGTTATLRFGRDRILRD